MKTDTVALAAYACIFASQVPFWEAPFNAFVAGCAAGAFLVTLGLSIKGCQREEL